MTYYTRRPLFIQRETKSTSTYWAGSRQGTPSNAILTEDGRPILSEDGRFLLTES